MTSDKQYLEYGGLGTGTPSMRQKQYRQHKFEKAIDDVHSHKTTRFGSDETSIAQPEKKAIRKTMISGANSGTHRLNKVLIDSGYIPDWIALEKEIRDDLHTLRISMNIKRSKLGPMPFTKKDSIKWDEYREGFQQMVRLIDSKIDKLNLIVPIMTRQKVHVNLDREIMKVLNEFSGIPASNGNGAKGKNQQQLAVHGYEDYTNILKSFFTKCFTYFLKSTWYYSNKIFHLFKVKYANKN
ncbi:dnaJ homolog subfamily C member 28-like [Exaiptasia diaphana]|uniref:DnaJ homologue subfamily C member 28 conserved domain-containing protein n=1 Tax=Exaiptasia diaphana TaxID=2652724 RepID=A0A913YEU1_EXADI|nr:dnaJ homolog subfamily C member 28-like [Exaiptasia diaphana]